MSDSVGGSDGRARFEELLAAAQRERYVFRLYVAGHTKHSALAIGAIRRLCDETLRGHADLEVVNIAESPEIAEEVQIIAAPTLLRLLPLPVRRVIGDMSNPARVAAALLLVQPILNVEA